ncbi:hypothetical protein [Mucilaginibacter segetis]|uniref:DUF3276 family protein n=1 Tax=Mucilaginibacter segetis TaxID=2793071 RepID=A0A934UMT6_9SPHI|nr:hypothetical protein [Mucilaginibacter segetis]MBK0379360.1 hypothetical protein [Mucilaginibacter segetis]
MEMIQKRRLDWEMFGEEGRLYYIDLMQGRNKKPYLQITRSDYKAKEKYERSTVIFFERDFEFLIEALSMVLTRYTHGEGRPA